MIVSADPAVAPAVSRLAVPVQASPGAAARSAVPAAGLAPTMAATRAESAPTGVWNSAPPVNDVATEVAGHTQPAKPPAELAATVSPSAPAPTSLGQETRAASATDPGSAGFVVTSGAKDESGQVGHPTLLGGYQVVKELGRGGMGAVFLARQLSLDRNVALKVMRPEWASDPTFVSRFTREAYAAAQLTHHNVVQIYDFGEDKGTNYFSMEFVRGQTLADLVREKSKLDPEVAVGYVLQAARGLKYAHDQKMIHRDVKPDNLLLNDQGIVKVADLGLVKTPSLVEAEVRAEKTVPVEGAPKNASAADSSAPITTANVAMGTPAFMAPEQARDAASVDARADIYSLGCTLYDLVTGRPPFEGRTAIELITKHLSEEVVPPDRLAKRVPKTLSAIILKMVAKKPDDRFANLGDVIRAFEEYLGVSSAGPFSPREEHANLLLESVEAYHAAPAARLRPMLLLGFGGALAAFVLLSALLRLPILAGGLVGLGFITAAAYFVLTGITRKTYLFLKTREFVFGSRPGEWLMGLAGVALFLAAVVLFHLVWVWLAFSIVAVLLAAGMFYGIDKRIEAERREPLERVEQMLRSMRLQGLEEDALRQFVCKYSGERWEDFFEDLFGYEAKRMARNLWGRGDQGRLRKTHAAWRDPLIDWMDAKQSARRADRERKVLQKVEERGLEAQGENLVVARRKAQRAAEAMVAMANEMREAARTPTKVIDRTPIADAMRKASEKPEEVLAERERGLIRAPGHGLLAAIIGPRPRFLVGAALLVGCLMWMDQNHMIDREKFGEAAAQVKDVGIRAAKEQSVAAVSELKSAGTGLVRTDVSSKHPLQLAILPGPVARLFQDFSPGVAGLILVVSSFFAGTRIAMFAIPGALVALFGPKFGLPSPAVSMAAGAVLGVLGLLFGRR